MDSFIFRLGKDAIEVIGEALDTAPLARRKTNPVVNTMQEQIIAQQQAVGPAPAATRKPRRKRAAPLEQAASEAAVPAGETPAP